MLREIEQDREPEQRVISRSLLERTGGAIERVLRGLICRAVGAISIGGDQVRVLHLVFGEPKVTLLPD